MAQSADKDCMDRSRKGAQIPPVTRSGNRLLSRGLPGARKYMRISVSADCHRLKQRSYLATDV
eukprot:233089-Pleurochrysis_carterae.AAC.1